MPFLAGLISDYFGISTAPAPPSSSDQNEQSSSSPRSASSSLALTNTSRVPNNVRILFGGLSFFLISTVVTKRALHRRFSAMIPPYYTSSVYHKPDINGALEALDAFSIATINVLSLGMVGTGMVMYALDVNSPEDLRKYVRRNYGVAAGTVAGVGQGTTDNETDKEIETWLQNSLGDVLGKYLKDEAERRVASEKANVQEKKE
ncbi:hypothetical protein C8Q69DRAFT_9277 [Paecilomyces variotii]|uniref:Altered inheritance of mitochondria protein 11 n=1 Tax=Byssochlamys spectabilis TaxID=264951 RepID=A0A443I4P2_BYSSP|nr:hypothetical protein C8Q69DRAFT_9277 [Paecilomyces variotii]KAJ9361769.1 hypothetical protein DTO280E4_3602 [Paecilomyces variotii]RWQ99049.1 hypothetical protein C8Q69DRAFT_9277 [Paecilomyces variotii]